MIFCDFMEGVTLGTRLSQERKLRYQFSFLGESGTQGRKVYEKNQFSPSCVTANMVDAAKSHVED